MLQQNMHSQVKLPEKFYINNDAITVAKELLGQKLFTCIGGNVTGGIITETEAYLGPIDKASHTYQNRRTPRTDILFQPGGRVYVYLIYGFHYLFNISVGPEGTPECVLIRALKPTTGIELMQERRFSITAPTTATTITTTKSHTTPAQKNCILTNGPAKMTKALAIDKELYGLSMNSDTIWIEKNPESNIGKIEATPRIGIDYAEEFKDKPWRFVASE